jgi:hypothetical protein
MERILEGSLARFEVPDLLFLLEAGRKTGVLVLEQPDQENKVFVRDGRPVFATSTMPGLRLGDILVRKGRADRGAIERALSEAEPGARIGASLLAARLVDERELASLLKVQVSEILFDCLGWSGGSFSFYDKTPPPLTVVTLDASLMNLLVEAFRRQQQAGDAGATAVDRQGILEALANPEHIKKAVALTQEEWRVFFLVDGRRTVDDVVRAAGDEAEGLAILSRLTRARLLRVVASVGRGEPAGLGTSPPVPAPVLVPPEVSSTPLPSPQGRGDDSHEFLTPAAKPWFGAGGSVTVARLILLVGDEERALPLVRDSYTLGRHKNNDIVVTDPRVSSFHARIDKTASGCSLSDLGSRNGTWVNGKKADQADLVSGDEIRLGSARLLYRVEPRL